MTLQNEVISQLPITQLIHALPDEFEFYHLGNVLIENEGPTGASLADENEDLAKVLEDSTAIGFRLQGELRALLVILVEKGLDIPTYSELGNVIASRLATRLSEDSDLEVLISPPQILSSSHVDLLPNFKTIIVQRTIRHIQKDKVIPIRMLLLSASTSPNRPGEAGHA